MTVCVIVCAWRRTYVCTLASVCTLAVVQYLKYKKKTTNNRSNICCSSSCLRTWGGDKDNRQKNDSSVRCPPQTVASWRVCCFYSARMRVCVRAFPEVGTTVPETISSLKKREKKEKNNRRATRTPETCEIEN